MDDTRKPIPYQPRFETPEEGELETQQGLVDTLHKISETTYRDSGHALRSVHAKSHGLLIGELKVLDNLPDVLQQGLFAHAATYPVVMRLSTTPGDLLDDSVSTPRGLAIKVVGVPGDRLDGSEGDATQDFLLINGKTFSSPGPKKFLGGLKLLAATTDKAPGAKKAISALFRGVEKVIEATGGKSATLISLGGHPETHILGETFYSAVPILYGRYMAKFSVVPISPELTRLAQAPLNVNGKPNGLREAVVDFFSSNDALWELRVQLCTNLETMPIEDASVEWPEDESPYIAVARISVKRQRAWSEARSRAIDDGMSFNPWHGIVDHRPLGSIMRVRKTAYEMSSKFRVLNNSASIVEPRSIADVPD